MDSFIRNGWAWDQLEFEGGFPFHGVLASLFAVGPDREPAVAGMAFAIQVEDEKVGMFCTAAHVIEYLQSIQGGPSRYHPSTPPEFRPQSEPFRLDRQILRAMHVDGQRGSAPVVDWVIWDGVADLAFVGLKDQDPEAPRRFGQQLGVTGIRPAVGTQVAMLGYDRMKVFDVQSDGRGSERFSVSCQPVFRTGTITRLHPEGHLLCRGPCFETTIPVSPGMSGSPVVLVSEGKGSVTVIGVVSSSPSSGGATLDRRVSGDSVVAEIAPDITPLGNDRYTYTFEFKSAQMVRSPAVTDSSEPNAST